MDTAYSWHPGTVRVAATGWAIPVELLPDELFSSWLVRTALANGCDPLTFTGVVWPKWRVWMVDVDRQPPAERLAVLSKMSNIPVEAFSESTLAPTALRILDGLPGKESAWPWVLAIGARNRRRSGGLQYCPMCLTEDDRPYFRLQWRFAWHIGCEKHGCFLEDRCPECGAPVEPHRVTAESRSVAHCPSCGSSLSGAKPEPLAEQSLEFQAKADAAATNGKTLFDGIEANSDKWFELARFYTGMVRRISRQETAWLVKVGQALSIQYRDAWIDPVPLELLRTRDRSILCDGVSRLLEISTEQLGALLAEGNVSRQVLFPRGASIPGLLGNVAAGLSDRLITRSRSKTSRKGTGMPAPRPKYEVERMMIRLQRKIARGIP